MTEFLAFVKERALKFWFSEYIPFAGSFCKKDAFMKETAVGVSWEVAGEVGTGFLFSSNFFSSEGWRLCNDQRMMEIASN